MNIASSQNTRTSLTVDTFFYRIESPADKIYTELIIKKDILLTETILQQIKKSLEDIKPKEKHYILLNSEGFFRITWSARKLCASAEYSSHMAAMAGHTHHASLSLLGELYVKLNKPAVPTSIFSTREDAVEWLEKQKTLAGV